jgi:GntR family transcriptional regulator / MocR family aminotransferase
MTVTGGGADFLQLSPAAAPVRGLTGWLADAIRAAIIDGRLPAGAPLPATRLLAGDLGVSRGVVVEAYQRLADEGLASGRPGAGTRVLGLSRPAERPPRPGESRPRPAERDDPALLPQRWRARAEIDLSPGVPDLSGFPRAAWMHAERLVLEQASVADLGYGDPRGSEGLRTELAGWLARTRGLRADPGDIIIVTGVAQALALLARVLRSRGLLAGAGDEIAVEDPGSRGSRDELAYWGLRPVPVPVDEHGLQVDVLARGQARAVLLTPAHQFPTGVVLAPRRRRDLLDWAAAADALIVEDDYDAEYRYDRAPVPALQASAPGLVAYAGSTSKTLAPGMRLGWLIPPSRLQADLVEAKHASDLGSPALPQLVLARLIASGELEQHIRVVRKRQRTRRDALLRALRSYLPEGRVQGIAAGLHLLVTFPGLAGPDTDLAEAILRAGVLVHPLSWHRQRPGVPGIVLGYAVHTPDQLHEAARRIAQVVALARGLSGRGRPVPLGRRRDALGVGAAVPSGHGPQLADARRPGHDDQEHAADGREQQGHAEREMTVRAHVGDVDRLTVLQDEDQQEQQDDGEETHRHPEPADPGAPDLVLRQRRSGVRGGGLFRWGRRLAARCQFPGGCCRLRRFGARRGARPGGGRRRRSVLRFRCHLAPPR